jgi:hypothetical protein
MSWKSSAPVSSCRQWNCTTRHEPETHDRRWLGFTAGTSTECMPQFLEVPRFQWSCLEETYLEVISQQWPTGTASTQGRLRQREYTYVLIILPCAFHSDPRTQPVMILLIDVECTISFETCYFFTCCCLKYYLIRIIRMKCYIYTRYRAPVSLLKPSTNRVQPQSIFRAHTAMRRPVLNAGQNVISSVLRVWYRVLFWEFTDMLCDELNVINFI